MTKRTLSIIIPVFNEEKTIGKVLGLVAAQKFPGWRKEIIIVDDGTFDSSQSLIQDFQKKQKYIKILKHKKNLGKGMAVRTGLTSVTGDTVVIQDADLEYDPAEIKNLLRNLTPGIDAVFGSRNLRPRRPGYLFYIWGDVFLTTLVNLFYGAKLTDVYTCYKLFRTNAVKPLELTSQGFEFEMEVTVKLLKKHLKIYEVPIGYYPRSFKEGKKLKFIDGVKGLWILIKNLPRK